MTKLRFSTKLVTGGVLGLLILGGTGWIIASASTAPSATDAGNTGSSVTTIPPGPPGKVLPAYRTAPPAGPTTPSPGYQPPGLSNTSTYPGCVGQTVCQLQGVLDEQQAPFPQTIFQVSNEYAGAYNGASIFLFAGEEMTQPTQGSSAAPTPAGGGLRVETSGDTSDIQDYPAPSGASRLTLVSVSSGTVTLQEQGGGTLTFSLATDSYS